MTTDEERLAKRRASKRARRFMLPTLSCTMCSTKLRTGTGRAFHERKMHGIRGCNEANREAKILTPEHITALARLRSKAVRGQNIDSAGLCKLLFGGVVAA